MTYSKDIHALREQARKVLEQSSPEALRSHIRYEQNDCGIRYTEPIETIKQKHARESAEDDRRAKLEQEQEQLEKEQAKQTSWAQWIDDRIATAVAAALEAERSRIDDKIAATVGPSIKALSDWMAEESKKIYDEMNARSKAAKSSEVDEMKKTRAMMMVLQSTIEEFVRSLRRDTDKVIDLPYPLRRAN
jgi:hypothetical protein